jgi:N-acetylated-alpha-linked acidic dipeptidase
MLYAPGLYTGYGAKTMPYVREALELRHWSDANDGIAVVTETLNLAAARIDQATALLGPAARAAGSAPPGSTTPPPDN